MDRQTAERLIFGKLLEIVEIYEKYRPGGRYLSMSLCGDWISANNKWWDDDKDRPIDFSIEKEYGKWKWEEEQNELDDCD